MAPDSEPAATERPDAPQWPRGLLVGCGGLVVAVLAISVSCGILATTGGPDDDEVDQVGAELTCEERVREQLRAPSTAEVETTGRTGTPEDGMSLSGTVDAENGFGATVRSTWTCQVRLDGDEWRGSATIAE